MNKRQRIIITIGIFLVILSGLFPSYKAEYCSASDNMRRYMGYYFLFLPPTNRDAFEALTGETPPSKMLDHQDSLSKFSSYIIMSRFWIQLITVIIVTLGLFILFGEKRNK